MRLLASLFGQMARLEEDATEIHAEATLAELAMSHGDLANLLRAALKAQHPGPDIYCWVRDVFDAEVVYELSNKDDVSRLYRRTYSVDDAGAVTLGEPVGVVAVTSYVAATESGDPVAESAELTGDLVPLVEKAVGKDGTASIKIIQAGQGSSGYYPADVLKRDGPKVFTAGTQIYLDHPSVSEESNRPERSVRDLAGSLTGPAAWKEDGAAGPGLYAPVRFLDSVAPHIEAIAPISGMSIRASGTAGTREVDGKKVRSIESIDVAHSVDVVTRPGAGGKVLDLIESARNRTSGGTTPPAEVDEVDKAEFEATKTALSEAQARIAEQGRELARLREADLIRQAHAVVVAELAKAALPAPTRERLTGQLAADPPLKDGALDREALVAKGAEAAKAELEYLASITGGAAVTGMGGGPADPPSAPALDESEKRIEAALKGL
jgi:hypothetical protein